MKKLIEEEINKRVKNRTALFNTLMDNELPNVGKVIIQSMNEDMAVILALKQLLNLYDVVASVLCVDSKSHSFIDVGGKYELIKESENYYTIYDNEGDIGTFEKECFKKL